MLYIRLFIIKFIYYDQFKLEMWQSRDTINGTLSG